MWATKPAASMLRTATENTQVRYAAEETGQWRPMLGGIAALLMLALLILSAATHAALPFTVKSGHPRVYLDDARIATIQTAVNATIPLNASAFPQDKGTIVLDIFPQPRTDTIDCVANPNVTQCTVPVFDGYENYRNHIFLRHQENISTDTTLGFQVAFQDNTGGNYVAVRSLSLTRDQWHTLRISWNSPNHQITVQVDGATPISLTWKQVNSVPVEWRPDGQKFSLRGRDKLDNVRIYANDFADANALVADFSLNEGSGGVTTSTVNDHRLRVSSGNLWELRAAGDYALQMGNNAGIRVVAPSLLSEAWVDTYNRAASIATTLNSGGEPLSPKTVHDAHPDSIIEIAKSLGLAWLVSGESRFLNAALVYADRLVNAPRNAGGEYSEGGRIEAMGVLYDWFFTPLGTTLRGDGQTHRVALATAVLETIRLSDMAPFICGNGNSLGADWTCRNGSGAVITANPEFIGGHSHGDNNKISVALFALFDEHPEIENLLNIEYQNFVNGYHPARAWIGVDGGHHMGWAYGAAYSDLDAPLLWETASDTSMREAWQGKLIDRDIYGLRGDFTFPASGDAFTHKLGNELEKSFALWGGKYFANGYGVNLMNNWILPRGDATGYSARIYELLLWEPNLAETSIETLEYSRWFRNAGNVLMRDTWNFPEATLLEFKSTSFYSLNHHHQDANAFTLYYKAPLALDAGYYDAYGTSHWHNYFVRSIAHNLITVWDPAETFIRNWTDTSGNLLCCSNDGGQLVLPTQYVTLPELQPGGSKHVEGVTAFEYTPDYTYTVGNASKAYSATKLDQTNGFVRSVVFLRTPDFWQKPVTVVFDKVTAQPGKENLTKRYLLHTVNEPVPPGGSPMGPGIHQLTDTLVETRNGGGLLFSQTLLPENPVLTKIGGKDTTDYRFMAPARGATDYLTGLLNYAPSPDPDASTTDGYVSTDMGNWRLEVSAQTPSQREYFLHVMSVADNDPMITAPPSALNLSTADVAAVLLADQQHIVFAKADQPASSIQWNTPTPSATSLITGLLPGRTFIGYLVPSGVPSAPYTVVIREDAAGSLQSSNQGVVNVTSVLPMATDLALTLSGTPGIVVQGETVTYTLTVTNAGAVAANGVTVTGSLPLCDLGVIAGGASASCSRNVTATSVGIQSQTMSVESTEFDPSTANNVASTTTQVQGLLTVIQAGSGSGVVTSTPIGVDCGVNCSQPYDANAVVILNAVAANDSTFSGWNGCVANPDNTCTLVIDDSKLVTVSFTLKSYTLSLGTSGTGSGAVAGGGSFTHGSTATVTATANAGSTFAGWTGPDGAECNTGTVTMTADKSCTATFTLNSYALTMTNAGTGTGTVTGAGTYNHGTTTTVTATASAGSAFDGWSGPDGAECATGSVAMTTSKNCTATFTLLVFKNPSAHAAQAGGDGNGYQGNPTYAYAADSLVAVDTNSGSSTNTSCTNSGKDKHNFYNYGFSIPTGATIKGIEVKLNAKADNTTGAPKICVQLSWDGGATWTNTKTTATLTKALADYTLGSATDTWGRTWSATNLNNTGFRVRVINVASNTSRDFSLNNVAVKVTY